jgi:hypothetical protein
MSAALPIALSAAVPLRIIELQQRGGPDDADYDFARSFGRELAEKADRLLYRGKPGESADLFNKLARAVAILAFCPGGVTIFGQKYEA